MSFFFLLCVEWSKGLSRTTMLGNHAHSIGKNEVTVTVSRERITGLFSLERCDAL